MCVKGCWEGEAQFSRLSDTRNDLRRIGRIIHD